MLVILCMAVLWLAGCGSMVALIDTQEAMEIVDRVNIENWVKTATAQVGFLDGELVKLDLAAAVEIDKAEDGPIAAGVFAEYLATRTALERKRGTGEEKYGAALDNAILAAELRARQKQIIVGWYGLFRMLPGVETMRALAETKARQYVADFNSGG